MSYLLFKLHFTAPVHFGSSDGALSLYTSEEFFRADTLFSALCHTALRSYGEEELRWLLDAALEDKLRFSDAMPWRGEKLYLPKPCVSSETSREIPVSLRKTVKKLKWIPVSAMEAFSASVHGGEPFVPDEKDSFGIREEYTRASVTEGEDTVPYQVGAFRFDEDCGLWFLCQCPEEASDRVERLVTMLGYSGIGGKISSGFGAFSVDKLIDLDAPFDDTTEWLSHAVSGDSDSYLLLTSCLPAEEEMDEVLSGAAYQLVRRGGFVQSETYAETAMKKQTQIFLSSGSVVKKRFCGDVFVVGSQGEHPVYRYSRPILLGVKL